MHRSNVFLRRNEAAPALARTRTPSRDTRFITVRSYLHALGKEHGLLLNFAKTTLEVKRVATARFEFKAV
jgi:hypothetical protein